LAKSLGWTERDLFGVYPKTLEARVDLLGLAWLLEGRRVAALTASDATIDLVTAGVVQLQVVASCCKKTKRVDRWQAMRDG
jgi:hypothetical protein